jgi:hypothetical protein
VEKVHHAETRLGRYVIYRIYDPICAIEPALRGFSLFPQADFRIDPRPGGGSSGSQVLAQRICLAYLAQGAIFFRYFRVASTFGVPTSSMVAAACRLRDERVVISN